jgi:uncharacterized membrane protein YfcA
MPDLTSVLSAHVFAITATFLLAGFVKGVIGLGLPTVAVGLLSLIMPPVQAAAMLIVPSFVTNIWQLAAGPRLVVLVKRFWLMFAAICVGTWAGGGLLAGDTTGRAVTALGLALVLYAVLGLTSLRLRVPAGVEPWLSPVIGALTGLVTAATGVFVLPAVPYLRALELDRDDLIQALGLSFTVSTVALAVGLARDGALPLATAGTSVLTLLPALAGMYVGQIVRARVSAIVFRRCFFAGLLLLGLHLGSRDVL